MRFGKLKWRDKVLLGYVALVGIGIAVSWRGVREEGGPCFLVVLVVFVLLLVTTSVIDLVLKHHAKRQGRGFPVQLNRNPHRK